MSWGWTGRSGRCGGCCRLCWRRGLSAGNGRSCRWGICRGGVGDRDVGVGGASSARSLIASLRGELQSLVPGVRAGAVGWGGRSGPGRCAGSAGGAVGVGDRCCGWSSSGDDRPAGGREDDAGQSAAGSAAAAGRRAGARGDGRAFGGRDAGRRRSVGDQATVHQPAPFGVAGGDRRWWIRPRSGPAASVSRIAGSCFSTRRLSSGRRCWMRCASRWRADGCCWPGRLARCGIRLGSS